MGVCFLQSLTHFVLLTAAQFLLLRWLLHPDPWPALKPTAQATGAAVQISQLQFRPFLPHPWLPDPAQSPIPAYCVNYLQGEAQAQKSQHCICYSRLEKTL